MNKKVKSNYQQMFWQVRPPVYSDLKHTGYKKGKTYNVTRCLPTPQFDEAQGTEAMYRNCHFFLALNKNCFFVIDFKMGQAERLHIYMNTLFSVGCGYMDVHCTSLPTFLCVEFFLMIEH